MSELNNATNIFTPRPEIYDAFRIYQITSCILLGVWSIFFVLETWGIVHFIRTWCQLRGSMSRIDKQTLLFRFYLYGNSFMNTSCFTLLLVLAFVTGLDAISCEVIARTIK
jgi:hypothetical protein